MKLDKSETVLISGGLGFIGFNFILQCQHYFKQIIIIDKNADVEKLNILTKFHNIKFIGFNLLNEFDANLLKNLKIDCFLHLASNTKVIDENDEKLFFDNINIFKNCLKITNDLNINKFINFSSSCVHGKFEEFPINFYGLSKLTIEKYLNLYKEKNKNFSHINFRLPNVYGPWIDKGLIFNLLSKNEINLYNNGLNIRSFIFIDDVITELCDILLQNSSYDYNLLTEHIHDSLNVCSIFLELTNKKMNLILQKNNEFGDNTSNIIDLKYIIDKDFLNLRDGLIKTINWYNNEY